MLIGYVSDEMHYAVGGASLVFEQDDRRSEAISLADGAIFAAIAPGSYVLTVQKSGYSSKRLPVHIKPDEPLQIRLLSDGLCGYVWPKWVRARDQGELRIHSTQGFTAELWRYGWQRERISEIGRFDDHPPRSLSQILPDTDIARDGVSWNQLGYSFPPTDPRVYVEAPDRSGLYYFRVRDEVGRFFSFPWIVAPSEPTSSIAVLASNITWNAYNDFGGRSNYVQPERLPTRPTVNPRQDGGWFTDPAKQSWDASTYEPLSFDRPEPTNRVLEDEEITDPIVSRGAEHLAPAEWRLLGWLEREGFDHDVYAETQFAAQDFPLDSYRVLVLSTHPEYWTRDMYRRLKEWVVTRGGRLAYLGGNGINCEVELIDGNRMIVFNGDNTSLPEGYESRFGLRGEPEASLLGVSTTHAGYETGAPYRVIDPEHWAFSGTGLARGDLFGAESLDRRAPGGASGHETDKRTPSTPPSAHLLAKGTNPDDGGAEMLHLEFSGGGQVFSAGSISYTCSIAVSPSLSAVTSNVLRRFSES